MINIFESDIVRPFIATGILFLMFAFLAYVSGNLVVTRFEIGEAGSNPSFFAPLLLSYKYLIFLGLSSYIVGLGLSAYVEKGRSIQLWRLLTNERMTIEVRLPKNTKATPLAMESFFEYVYLSGGEGSWWDRWVMGRTRPIISFEIVSNAGIVYFYINMPVTARENLRNGIYAFFPGAQIAEVNDYVNEFDNFDPDNAVFGFEFKLAKGPQEPLKTYKEHSLAMGNVAFQEDTERSAPLDQLVPLYDLMSSIGEGERIWLQFVTRTQKWGHVVEEGLHDNPFKKEFSKEMKLKDLLDDRFVELSDKSEGEAKKPLKSAELRAKQNLAKLAEKSPFEVGIRILYLVDKDATFQPNRIASMVSIFRLTNSAANTLIPYGRILNNYTLNPLKDEVRYPDKKNERLLIMQLYRDRMFWFPPAQLIPVTKKLKTPLTRKSVLINTETLATICHLPTSSIVAPSVRRALATQQEAPDNVPI